MTRRFCLAAMGPLATGMLVVTPVLFGCGGGQQHAITDEGESRPSVHGGESSAALQVRLERLEVVDPIDAELLEAARDRVMADVRNRQSQRHGQLPPVQRTRARSPDAWPEVFVRNNTPHGLVVWFAGPCPRTMALPPRGQLRDQVCEGEYDVAAELASDDYLPFVGEANTVEKGNRYTLTFYVVAAPRRVIRPRRP